MASATRRLPVWPGRQGSGERRPVLPSRETWGGQRKGRGHRRRGLPSASSCLASQRWQHSIVPFTDTPDPWGDVLSTAPEGLLTGGQAEARSCSVWPPVSTLCVPSTSLQAAASGQHGTPVFLLLPDKPGDHMGSGPRPGLPWRGASTWSFPWPCSGQLWRPARLRLPNHQVPLQRWHAGDGSQSTF